MMNAYERIEKVQLDDTSVNQAAMLNSLVGQLMGYIWTSNITNKPLTADKLAEIVENAARMSSIKS